MFLAYHFWWHLIYSASYHTSTEDIFQHQTVNRKKTKLKTVMILSVSDQLLQNLVWTNGLHLNTNFKFCTNSDKTRQMYKLVRWKQHYGYSLKRTAMMNSDVLQYVEKYSTVTSLSDFIYQHGRYINFFIFQSDSNN